MSSPSSGLQYSRALDGLRALSVLAIIGYHLNYEWALGSYLAVDLFFVLSGFLITSLLLSEHARNASIKFRDFFARRARRLLPAMFVIVALVAVLNGSVLDPVQRTTIRNDQIASLFYVANWRFIADGESYFDVFAAPSPMRHMWTLAIEAQFYLVWPFLVGLCLWLARGSKKLLGGVCVAAIAASAVALAVTFRPEDPSRAYYGTDARVHTMLIGALLAVVLAGRNLHESRALRVAGPIGMVAVLVLWLTATPTSARYYHGGSVAYAVLAAVVIAAALQPGRFSSVLGWWPLFFIGQLSYGIYLFHWPVIIWLVPTRVGIDGYALDALRVAVTFGAAALSYYLIEKPVRTRRLPRRVGWSVGLATTAAVALAVLVAARSAEPPPSYLVGVKPTERTPSLQNASATATVPGTPLTVAPAVDDWEWHLGDPMFCGEPRDDEAEQAADGADAGDGAPIDTARARDVRILLIGDSTACSMYPGLHAVAGDDGAQIVQASVIGCGVVSGEITTTRGEQITPNSSRCPHLVDIAREQAAAAGPPDVVLWMSLWEKSDLVVDGTILVAGTPEWRTEMLRRMDDELARLGTTPVALVTTAAPAPNDAQGVLDTSNEIDDASYGRLDAVLHEFARRHPDQVTLLDVAARLCPDGPPCPRKVDGRVPRPDGRHLDSYGSGQQARWIYPQLIELAHR
jgi:peptidoglycan/LPS O-acetylase OafA/YrhL